MLSSCVLYHPDIILEKTSQQNFDSLRFLYFKFDLFILNSPQQIHFSHWLQSTISLRRVVAKMTPNAQVDCFFSLDLVYSEWIGNIDVFVDFPMDLQQEISAYFPCRIFLTMNDVLNPEFIPDAVLYDR